MAERAPPGEATSVACYGRPNVRFGWKADVPSPSTSFVDWDWLTSDRVAVFLDREAALLAELFGGEAYEVEDVSPDVAIIRSTVFEMTFAYDRRRARDLGTSIKLLGLPSELSVEHGLGSWARFLEEDIPVLPTNASGIITVPLEVQVRDNLKWVARFAREIFSDPQRTRDAVHFADGYDAAYTDYCSGKWDPD